MYTKLANSILTSTIWMEDDHTRLVWLALLAMADKNGEVAASIPGLANIARVPIESVQAALKKFLSPDEFSRSKECEGRRIMEIKGGWFLINHEEYRKLASDEDRKEKAAIRQARARLRKKVTPESRQISQAEAKADTKAEANPPEKERKRVPSSPSYSRSQYDQIVAEEGLEMIENESADHFAEIESRNFHDITGEPILSLRGYLKGRNKKFLTDKENLSLNTF